MSDLELFTEACLKHLQGKHNQRRHGWRYTGDALANARSAMRGQSAGERGEYRKRAGMAEPKKVERKTADSGMLPEGKISGKTIRQYKNNKYEMERVTEEALSSANSIPKDRLKTRNAERELRIIEKQNTQMAENESAMREFRRAKKILDTDIVISQEKIFTAARKIEFINQVNRITGGTINPSQALENFDFSSPQSVFKSLMDLLDRRYGSIRQRYSR